MCQTFPRFPCYFIPLKAQSITILADQFSSKFLFIEIRIRFEDKGKFDGLRIIRRVLILLDI